jgi:hypothetical protein
LKFRTRKIWLVTDFSSCFSPARDTVYTRDVVANIKKDSPHIVQSIIIQQIPLYNLE